MIGSDNYRPCLATAANRLRQSYIKLLRIRVRSAAVYRQSIKTTVQTVKRRVADSFPVFTEHVSGALQSGAPSPLTHNISLI